MARNWRDIRADAVTQGLLDTAKASTARKQMHEAVQAHRLAEVRRALTNRTRQVDVAALMDVSQAWISKLENGEIAHTELGTLQAYVAALGGHLRVIAEFADDTIELTT